MPKYKFARKDVVSAEELESTLAKTNKFWLKAMISFLYIFGARITEVLKLRKRNFRVEGRRLIVQIVVSKRRSKGPIKEIPHILQANLSTPFIGHVLAWLKQVENPDDLVWHVARSWSGSRYKIWKEMKALNPNISPHVFRHTRLTKLVLRGADGPDLMDWAGWTDLRPAAEYIHPAGRLAKKFADKID